MARDSLKESLVAVGGAGKGLSGEGREGEIPTQYGGLFKQCDGSVLHENVNNM